MTTNDINTALAAEARRFEAALSGNVGQPARTHTYVECCDRYALIERTYWDTTISARLCRPGMGCQHPVYAD